MSKYIKLFKTQAEYDAWAATHEAGNPTASYILSINGAEKTNYQSAAVVEGKTNMSISAHTENIAVTANCEWIITSYPSWVSFDRLTGVCNDTLTMSVTENKMGARSGNIVYQYGISTGSTVISQEGVAIENNKILYTSTDGKVISASHDVYTGATLVSNTYTDGVGTMTFSDNILAIQIQAFAYRTKLNSIVLPNSVTTIEGSVFESTKLTELVLPNSLITLKASALANITTLTAVTIPSGVTSIGAYCFSGDSALANITYEGTIVQWNAITKDGSWKQSVPATVVHCTDGDVDI